MIIAITDPIVLEQLVQNVGNNVRSLVMRNMMTMKKTEQVIHMQKRRKVILAIRIDPEDYKFLKDHGYNISSLGRAFFRDLVTGHRCPACGKK